MTCTAAVFAGLLAASSLLAQTGPPAGGNKPAPTDEIAANENLVVEGIPAIPGSVAELVRPYTEGRSASFTSWHPVRREMLIVTRFADAPQIHAVRTPGGDRRQMTFFPDRVRGGVYPPAGDGSFFLFAKDTGGGEFFQIYRYDVATGAVTLLTDGKSRNDNRIFSRSGNRIAYTSTRRNGQDTDLYVLDPRDPKTDHRLAELAGGGWEPLDWSPDGRSILVLEGISVSESYLWIFDSETGERKAVTPRGRFAEKVAYSGGEFSADGKSIYTASDLQSEFQRLVRIDLTGGTRTVLTPDLSWGVEEFTVTRDGRRLAYVTNEDGASVLRVRDFSTGKETPVAGLSLGSIASLRWHSNGRDLAFSYESARSQVDAYSYDADRGALERWTESETGGLNPQTFREAELVRWRSFDGRMISGFLYTPDPAKFPGKRPIVVNIHGGPESQSRAGYRGRGNLWMNELGVAVIYPNVRGSSGYGKTFSELDNGVLREDSVKDIGALLDWIPSRADLDASRIMITGGSYGGYMTLASAVAYDARIRCSLDVVGISNFVTFLERTEAYRRDLRRVEYGDERDPKTRAILEKISPLTNAAKITKPLFVVQGMNDPRVARAESEQMVAMVRKNGSPVWYLMARDEGHGFAKKRNQDYQLYASIAFVREYLLK